MSWDGKDRSKKAGSDPVTNDDLGEALALHAEQERAYVRQLLEGVMRAFPNGDIQGHFNYHDQKNKAAQAEEEFWKAAKLTLIQAGVAGIIRLVWVIFLLIALGLTVKFAMPESVVKFILGLLSR